MAITRKLVAHDENEDNQWLKIDHPSRYIQNCGDEWQFIFGPDSILNNSAQVLKLTAKFDDNTFDNIKCVGYLYEPTTGAVANSASCTFNIYKVTSDWVEVPQISLSGTQLANSYFYINPTLSTLSGFNFDGGDTMMIEAEIVRSGRTYRDRVYINHLGIYDSFMRLKQEVEFLDLTKVDE